MAQMKAIVDQLLTGVSNSYQPQGYIGDNFFPLLRSAPFSGKIGSRGIGALRIVNSLAGGEGKFRRVKAVGIATTNFNIETHGLETVVTEEDYRNYSDAFDAEAAATQDLKTSLSLEKSLVISQMVTDPAVITPGVVLSGTDKFSDYSLSNPVGVITAAK